MQLDHALLRTFLACVDAMSFSRAATRVHKSPATVSMQIQRLEDRIGKPLFVRDTRNLALTRAGEELEGYARRILRLHDEAVEAFVQSLNKGKVVGLINGRMEFGPRALGNRSIIVNTSDKSINEWLNTRLGRNEFMPFAPVIRSETAKLAFKNFFTDSGKYL